jgi:hypothetical protein
MKILEMGYEPKSSRSLVHSDIQEVWLEHCRVPAASSTSITSLEDSSAEYNIL